jgi:wyosine [tRNA(Phe)-imidazoG37] synthetase (radical SAM superfamily)
MMKYDRFNLEEEIQNVWQTKDDLNAITERIYDDPDGPMTEDEISNVLIGLSELHETRCKKLWRVFETMIKEKGFNLPEKETFPDSSTGRTLPC